MALFFFVTARDRDAQIFGAVQQGIVFARGRRSRAEGDGR